MKLNLTVLNEKFYYMENWLSGMDLEWNCNETLEQNWISKYYKWNGIGSFLMKILIVWKIG